MKPTGVILTLLALTSLSLGQILQVYNFECGRTASETDENKKLIDIEYVKGDKMYLCIQIMPFGIRLPFRLVVDDFNMIEVKDCKLSFFYVDLTESNFLKPIKLLLKMTPRKPISLKILLNLYRGLLSTLNLSGRIFTLNLW